MIDKFLKHHFKLRKDHVPDPNKIRGAYVKTFSTPVGRVVLDDLIASYGSDCFDSDSHVTARNIGRREVVENIVMMIEDSPHEP